MTSLVALIIGLVKKDDVSGAVYESHFEFVTRTNIWGLVAGLAVTVIGVLTMIILIGFLILPLGGLAVGAWYLVRLVVGLIKLMDDKPIDNPRTWLI